MIIGVPKELINGENRVAMTPAGVHALVLDGHTVFVEKDAGAGCGMEDDEYLSAGGEIKATASEIWAAAELICKVKEPQVEEYELMRPGQTLFTYLHLAANRVLTEKLLEREVCGIAYETVMTEDGFLPLLAPMSEVAGRMSVQIGSHLLQKHNHGRGILLAGVPGVLPGEVLVIGAGVVGQNAAHLAAGLGARVTIADLNVKRLKEVDQHSGGRISTLISNPFDLAAQVKNCDLLIGAVLIPGAKAPHVVSEAMVKTMKKGAVIVDVAIDQGGCIETMDHITTHADPYFIKHGVVHYSVANIPGAVPRTSTLALTGVTLPYMRKLAGEGIKEALLADESLRNGLNTYAGKVSYQGVAEAFDLPYTDALTCLAE